MKIEREKRDIKPLLNKPTMGDETISVKTEFKINEIELIDNRIKQLENVVKWSKDDRHWKANYDLSNEIIHQATIQHLELEIKTLKSIRAKVILANEYLLKHKRKDNL